MEVAAVDSCADHCGDQRAVEKGRVQSLFSYFVSYFVMSMTT
jgi:hypothetical protein